MKVLVIGSGAREHTLVWKLKQSKYVSDIYITPGNAGVNQIAEPVNIKPDSFRELAHFASRNCIDLTIVGPEELLSQGIVDYFISQNLRIFGPTKIASQIETSKVFSKEFMRRHRIPTASYKVFEDVKGALKFLETHKLPLVIKADGLTGGKGTFIINDPEEAKSIISHLMIERAWGEAGKRIIIEECLEGEEVSFFALTDGREVLPLMPIRDYKRLYDDDEGPNTGGMGAVAPHMMVNEKITKDIMDKVIYPAVEGMMAEGYPFKGALYAGIMITQKGIKVLEFNCRLGDPETEVMMPLLRSDILELLYLTAEGRLDEAEIFWSNEKACSVVLASEGYPKRYKRGALITGLNDIEDEDIIVFHAGTDKKDNDYISSGGRVLAITGIGQTYEEAITRAYNGVDKIAFERAIYRNDIGDSFLESLNTKQDYFFNF